MTENACLPAGSVLSLFSSMVRLWQEFSERIQECQLWQPSPPKEAEEKALFFPFEDPLDYEPHPYLCHRTSNGPVFKKSVKWVGMEVPAGVWQEESRMRSVSKILLLEVSIPCAQELPYVKAKKNCHRKETLLCGHLAYKYICVHICAGIQTQIQIINMYFLKVIQSINHLNYCSKICLLMKQK